MRVLLLNQFFWPDGSATSQLLTDLARRLCGAGHEVTVICSDHEYSPGDRAEAPPVRIVRVGAPRFRRGAAGRLLSYVSFLVLAIRHGLREPKPDVVVSMTTPPGLALIGELLRVLRGARHCVWEMDMYPDVAVGAGFLRADALLTKALGKALDYPRKRADRVITGGECMAARLRAHGVPAGKIRIAENWAPEPDFPFSMPALEGALRVLYSGNLGHAHDVETAASAMIELKDSRRVEFTYGGGGPGYERLLEFCVERGISNARFLPYCPPSEHAARVAAHDIGLVTQKTACAGSVVPSKVYALLAAGRPYIFIGPAGATPGLLVERHGCGWRVDCGRAGDLAGLLACLSENPGLVREAAQRARALFVSRYERGLGVERVARIVEDVADPVPCAVALGSSPHGDRSKVLS
jgi:glycosyltransferase involved in cell wall biosynthesis